MIGLVKTTNNKNKKSTTALKLQIRVRMTDADQVALLDQALKAVLVLFVPILQQHPERSTDGGCEALKITTSCSINYGSDIRDCWDTRTKYSER